MVMRQGSLESIRNRQSAGRIGSFGRQNSGIGAAARTGSFGHGPLGFAISSPRSGAKTRTLVKGQHGEMTAIMKTREERREELKQLAAMPNGIDKLYLILTRNFVLFEKLPLGHS
jgi:hypothetical protein